MFTALVDDDGREEFSASSNREGPATGCEVPDIGEEGKEKGSSGENSLPLTGGRIRRPIKERLPENCQITER